jgi:hypothetical protein
MERRVVGEPGTAETATRANRNAELESREWPAAAVLSATLRVKIQDTGATKKMSQPVFAPFPPKFDLRYPAVGNSSSCAP